ncbi:DUF1949 domain-containing protein [Coriobacteriaceae bacterium]|nr:DUF1949 domain-containing protein [Coriobacteriaceae bacterium]
MKTYLTLKPETEAVFELVDRKSRFIAALRHVETEAEAEGFVDEVRALHHDARHHVPAWVLASGKERASDDGEPQRTSGLPSLDALRGAGLADVCAVTTRYFGGTLLGPGGLVRAYGGTVAGAVEEARSQGIVVEMRPVTRVACCIPYAWYDQVRRMARDAGGKVVGQIFTDEVQLTCDFRAGEEEAFRAKVTELASGRDLCVVHGPRFAEF